MTVSPRKRVVDSVVRPGDRGGGGKKRKKEVVEEEKEREKKGKSDDDWLPAPQFLFPESSPELSRCGKLEFCCPLVMYRSYCLGY